MIDDMRMRKLSPQDPEPLYPRGASSFTGFLGRSPDTATAEDLRRYQLHLVETGTSPVSLNATITGLRFFFEVTLDRPEVLAQDEPGARAAQAAGGVEPRGGGAPDRGGRQPEVPGGVVGGLWRRACAPAKWWR